MTTIADLLDLRRAVSRLWVVASNGAVVFRYPPLEVVHEETFDARPAVEAILRGHPSALVAVEERGVGYRVNQPVPGRRAVRRHDHHRGAPTWSPQPVSRVIIRDPDSTAEDFVDARRPARPARHRLRRRLDGVARPRAGRGLQGLRARPRRRAARGRRGRRAGHRRRPQRHRDAAVGRPRGGHGPGRRAGASRPPTTSPAPCTRTAPRTEIARCFRGLPEIVDTARLRLPLWTAADIAHLRGAERGARLAPDFPRAGRPRRGHDVARRRPVGAALDRARRGRGRLDRTSSARRRWPPTASPRPRSARLVEDVAGAGVATEALTACSTRPTAPASGSGQRAPGQRAEHPGARQVRLHRAARQHRGRRAGHGPPADGERLPAAGRHRPRRHAGPLATAPSRRTPAQVLAELDERGVPVVFVTGRPLRWAEERLRPRRPRTALGRRLQRRPRLGRRRATGR